MSTQQPIAVGDAAPQPIPASTIVPGAAPAATAPILRSPRVGAALETHWRILAGLVGIVALAFGGVLAWREESEGIAVASAFAVGLVTLIFALAGVVPASIKVGDVEVQLQQAAAEGKQQGKQEGAVAGLQTAAAVCEKVKEGVLQPEEVEAALTEALSTAAPLDFPAVSAPPLAVANLGADAPATANAIAQALSPAPDTPSTD